MSEVITLATPVTKPNQTTVRLTGLMLDVENKRVTIMWTGNNNGVESGQAVYPTPAPSPGVDAQGVPLPPTQPTGAVLLTTLNTANLTTKSLIKRTLERLQLDGYLPAGPISGTPT